MWPIDPYYQYSYDIAAASNLLLRFMERRKIHLMKHTRLRHHSVQYLQNRPLTPCLVLCWMHAPCFNPQNTIPNNRRNQHIDRNIIQQNLRVLQQHPVVMAANPPVLLPPPLMFFPNSAVLDQLSMVSNGRMIPGVAQDQHFLQQLAPQQGTAGLIQGGGLSISTRAGLGLSVNPAFHQQAMAMSSYLEAAQSNPPRQHIMPQLDEELKRKENSIPYSRGDSTATTASSSRRSASTSRTTSSPSPPPLPEKQL